MDNLLIKALDRNRVKEYLELAHGFLKSPFHLGIEDRDSFVQETRNTAEQLLSDDNTVILVAVHDDKYIGYLAANIHPALHVNGWECMVREVYIHPNYQRRGIGTSLMKSIESIAKERGAKRISLAARWDDNFIHKEFYSSLGFSKRCDFIAKKLV